VPNSGDTPLVFTTTSNVRMKPAPPLFQHETFGKLAALEDHNSKPRSRNRYCGKPTDLLGFTTWHQPTGLQCAGIHCCQRTGIVVRFICNSFRLEAT